MQKDQWEKINELCDKLSKVTYENLTKIIRLNKTGSSSAAQKLDDSFQNDVDAWMGGGTCFSMTWYLYQSLRDMGLRPRLVMGHKRKERNIHCALILPDETPDLMPTSAASRKVMPTEVGIGCIHPAQEPKSCGLVQEYLFDPGYMIFEPLPMPLPPPFGPGTALFPLVPNCVRLERPNMESMELWTGGAIQASGNLSAPMKLRFDYPVAGVSVEEFKQHWNESFYREMMNYPVLNRLDREKGIQYYYQKGNLVTRDSNGSRMERIDPSQRVETLSRIFGLDAELVENALGILEK